MLPAQKFLAKIKWDKNLNPDDFEIGIYDRVKKVVSYRKFSDIKIDKNDKFSFVATDENGNEHVIPFHRIRVIKEREKLVWERPWK